MKLTFKDFKQQKFVIEVEPTETISQLKEKITADKGWESSLQKLIYSGKILQDDKTVESYNIEEKGFVVCMVSKPKHNPAAAASSSAPTPVRAPSTPAQISVPSTPTAPVQPVASSSTIPAAVPETPTPASASTSAPAATFNDPSALAMGGAGEEAIASMIGMGFERNDVERAMRAAFYNPDRAVDYLLNGIPEHLAHHRQAQPAAATAASPVTQPQPRPAPAASGVDAPGEAPAPQNINLFEAAAAAAASQRAGGRGAGGAAAVPGAGASAGLGNLDFLRNNPQFQQLRQIVQQQPQMLEPILQQVGLGNPQLAALISQNPDAFLQLLSEDAGDEEGGQLPPGSQQISVTPEERDAIERLCRLGFDRDMVIQAYFACDKNEELAANFLFEQPPDDDDA